VLNVALHEGQDDEASEGEVHLIYGTTNLKMMQRRRDFFVTNMAEMDLCGLDKATRFDLDKIAWVPWAEEWFDTLSGYTSPIVGHLSQHSTKLLQFELARRKAQALKAIEQQEGNEG